MTHGDGPVWAIVLAAGRGTRFGRLKQFEPLAGRRLVDRTVDSARRTCDRVALVLPPGVAWDGPEVDVLVEGGDHQSESLRAALAAIDGDAAVLVATDPAHPLAPDRIYTDVVAAVRAGADGAVPVLPLLEVVQRVVDGRVVDTLPKDGTVITQAPQAFRADVLRAAHADLPRPIENSGMLVALGHRVVTVPGDPGNLHVATSDDLRVLERLADPPPHPAGPGSLDTARRGQVQDPDESRKTTTDMDRTIQAASLFATAASQRSAAPRNPEEP